MIREVSQNLHVKLDHDGPPRPQSQGKAPWGGGCMMRPSYSLAPSARLISTGVPGLHEYMRL